MVAVRCVSEHRASSVWPQLIAADTSPVCVRTGWNEVYDNPTDEYLVQKMTGRIA